MQHTKTSELYSIMECASPGWMLLEENLDNTQSPLIP